MQVRDGVVRFTQSVCAVCAEACPAEVCVRAGAVYLIKMCARHGESSCLLSRHPDYHVGLDRYYFGVMGVPSPQRDYLLRLTERCNLACPICLASAVSPTRERLEGSAPPADDLSRERLGDFLDRNIGRGRLKIDLLAAEPTLRPDLLDIVRDVKSRGHIVALHTNGVRLTSQAYCQALRKAGVDEIHLQMDGFDDEACLKIRGRRLTAAKRRVIENLEASDLATDMVMVVMPGTNEHQIAPMLEETLRRSFVRELFFLGTRPLGYLAGSDAVLMPDEVIDLVERESQGLCARADVYRFQKLYFALLSLLGVRKCLYVQHYLLFRNGTRWLPVSDVVDLERAERVLDELVHLPRRWGLVRLVWCLRLALSLISGRALRYLPDFFGLLAHLRLGWRLSSLPRRTLIVGYITACDPYNLDEQVARYCGKGEVSCDLGETDCGAHANILRERRWRLARRLPVETDSVRQRVRPPCSERAAPHDEDGQQHDQ